MMLSFSSALMANFLLLVRLQGIRGMADLSPDMLQARNLEELEQAQQALWDDMAQERRNGRHLQELEDSQHILADHFNSTEGGFYHGVASGDPLHDSVIIWTRYTPVSVQDDHTLELRMAAVETDLAVDDHLDPAKNPNLHQVRVQVSAQSDFVAKLDVVGLQSGTTYVFAFADENGKVSPTGQTKTAPGPNDKVESMVYAVFSCSHFSNGYFHAYDIASTISDLDFWIHTGDYVYEYGTFSSYANDSPERVAQILPLWEQISLQDHRNRMATYHTDEGLQNLRRRAPLIAIWDDHETTNNPWGQGTKETTGAENHQETCSVNVTATDAEKNSAQCDRDEGDIVARLNAAAQSYFEWMPVRHFPGKMGVVDIGSLTQVVSWGDMATIVTFDTRISHRSMEPTLNSNTWAAFFPFVNTNTDVSEYRNQTSEVYTNLTRVATDVAALLESDEFSMIGNDVEILRTNFQESASKGQPWQIWATATALGRAVKGDYSTMHEFVQDATVAEQVKNITDQIFAADQSTFFRALTAEALTSIPWNRDDYSGFAHEQRIILDMVKDVSSNPIVLAGDLHDGYGWTLYEGGAVDGTPCAVNLVCPGVTSPGWGPFLFPAFSVLSDIVGGDDEVYSLLEQADEAANPGLKYYNLQYKGFFAVKATKQSHVAEYFTVSPETVLADYDQARTTSGKIVADFACDTQLTTTAGMPGSLERQDSCSLITFVDERPATWDIAFPLSSSDPSESLETLVDCGYQQCTFRVAADETDSPADAPDAPSDAPTGANPPSKTPNNSWSALLIVAGLCSLVSLWLI